MRNKIIIAVVVWAVLVTTMLLSKFVAVQLVCYIIRSL